MSEKDSIIEIAKAEIGYLEKSRRAVEENYDVLYEKIEGAGNDNMTKYAAEMDAMQVYNTPKQGYAWCKVFVDWCFTQALGLERAGELLYGWTAGVEQFYNWAKAHDSVCDNPEVGDLIIFGNCDHIGIVTDYDESRVYTIEGNTSGTTGLVANGGSVAEKSYSLNSSYIKCYVRPEYEECPLKYKVHLENIGWTDWTEEGEIAGTVGDGRRLEAIIIDSPNIDLKYRAHVESKDWMNWVNEGEIAGTENLGLRMEALEIQSSIPLKVSEHIQDVGWMPASYGTHIRVGTEGKGLRLEAIKIETI